MKTDGDEADVSMPALVSDARWEDVGIMLLRGSGTAGEIAWRQFMRRFIGPLERELKNAGHRAADVEDILENVCRRTLEYLRSGQFDPVRPEKEVRAWLGRLARFETASQYRWLGKGGPKRPLDDVDAEPIDGLPGDLSDDVVFKEVQEHLATSLARLSEVERRILLDHYADSRGDDELAADLNSKGHCTARGRPWTASNIAQVRLRLLGALRRTFDPIPSPGEI